MVGGEVDDNLMATELRLGLPGTDETQKPTPVAQRGTKRALDNANEESLKTSKISNGHESDHMADIPHETAPAAKSRVVGWPPVQTFRKNSFQARKMEAEETLAGIYVKVSMEGAPYLRKIDLKFYEGYKELRERLENMFRCFSIGTEYAIAYEDKDGDLMLVGDVPWEMFTSSCKRLRIMKGCEGRGVCSNT